MLAGTWVAALAAFAAAIVAIVQARSARRSELDAIDARNEARAARDESARLAGEANTEFRRSADATERLAAMEEERSKPPIWSGPRYVSGDLYQMVNTSGRSIVIGRIEIDPEEAAEWFSWEGNGKPSYDFGDSFDFMTPKKVYPRVRRIDIHWRYADSVDEHLNVFIVPLWLFAFAATNQESMHPHNWATVAPRKSQENAPILGV